ncbi:hypothetical protein [Streptomyces albipurpureus]|uniref:Integral membrane protein n=1 Tax=Streptomyces albipurpureus TaxID=2897419 RepID=A0ABT0UJ62_9ACTN|nr:hypothetical protein [Streptomyces sp. CWNU-1]MCM2388677.1 hypothetical protein [Streptomyces sp. CWNU-1]
MDPYFGTAVGLAALLFALCGVAALGWGWLPPWQRRHIARPRLFGWAQLTIAAAFVIQLVGGLLLDDWGTRSSVTMPGAVVALFGLVMMMVAQREPRTR